MRLLVIEDERALADSLSRGLAREGYAVDVAYNADQAFLLYGSNAYDLLILDLTLPDMDGLQVLDAVRSEHPDLLVLILTARTHLEDRVRGLDGGADDYLMKPFEFAELSARLRALLRRESRAQSPILRVGDLALDPATRRVWQARRPVMLTPREFGILEDLMRRPTQVVSQEEILEHVWGDEVDPFTGVVRVHIASLRRKLNDDSRDPRYIHTRLGVGYWIADS